MKKIISLTKIFYKVNNNNFEKIGMKKKVLIFAFVGAYILYVFVNFWGLFISPLKEIGKPELSISLILNISNIFVYMTSIMYIANILYFSNDIQSILPFPFKPKEIFTSKLLTVYFYELAIMAMLLVPAFISYAQHMNEGISFYFFSFIIYLMVPIIPILLISLIYLVITQLFNISKYKNFFKIFSTILLLVVIFSFQLNLNNNMNTNGEYSGEYILKMCESLNEKIPYYLKVAVDTVSIPIGINKVISLIWYMVINFVFAALVILLCSKLYIKSVYSTFEIGTRRKFGSINMWKKQKSQIHALFSKEIKVLFRNSTYFIQCVLPTFLVPIIMLIMSTSTTDEIAQTFYSENIFLKIYGSILIIEFFMIMNYISITAVSRDGRDEALYLKTLPVDLKKQIKAKIMPALLFGMINVVISLIFCYKLFSLKLVEVLILSVVGFWLNLVQAYLFIIIDLKNPKIYWESELAVVKQNMNLFYGICLWIGVIITTSIFCSLFMYTNNMFFVLAFLFILVLVYVFLSIYITKNKDKLFDKIF